MATRTKDQNTLAGGEWNVICDVCGFKFKSSDVRKRWDGLYVCKEDYEQRHPMDFQKGFADDESVPFSRQDSIAEPSVYTDVDGNSNSNDLFPDTHGDVTYTIIYGTDSDIHEWNTTLTANRVAQLQVPSVDPTVTAKKGDQIRIYYTATSSNTFSVWSSVTILRTVPGTIQWVGVYQFNGSVWEEVSYTTTTLP